MNYVCSDSAELFVKMRAPDHDRRWFGSFWELWNLFCWCIKQEVWVVCADTGLMLWMWTCGSRCWETVHHTHLFCLLSLSIYSLSFHLHFLIIYNYFVSLFYWSCHSYPHWHTHAGFVMFVPLNWARLLGSPSSEVTDRDWRTFMFVSLWQRNKEMKRSNKQINHRKLYKLCLYKVNHAKYLLVTIATKI